MSSGRSGQPDYSGTVLGPRMVPATNERRTIVFNDPEITSGAPPSNRSADDYGKFFPRGMRGTLEEIRVYAQGDGVDTVYVNISPQPGLGYTYRTQITPPAAWGWVDAAFNIMWNYDSLYVWFSDIEANVNWGYDEEKPYDGHLTADGGATFTDVDERPFIRVVMTGETAGDVPISGIVNNIPIPSASSAVKKAGMIVPFNVVTEVLIVEGAGYCDFIEFSALARVNSHLTSLSVWCDGVRVFQSTFQALRYGGYHPGSSPVSVMRYAESGICWMTITKRWEFRRELRLTAYNFAVQQEVSANVYPNMMR